MATVSVLPQALDERIAASCVQASLVGLSGTVIGTHSGTFHCDEALAIAMLKVLPQYASASIVRTRDAKIFPLCNMLVDVGAVYDAENNRFDHHQASFVDTYDTEHEIRLSSAGLIYKHFGHQIVSTIVNSVAHAVVDKVTLEKLVLRTYDHFIMELDAVDNGVDVCEGRARYHISTGLASRVARLNPGWNEVSTELEINNRFKQAMSLTGSEFLQCVLGYVTAWLPARAVVQRAIASSKEIHPSGSILVLDCFCPWKDHLFELEAEAEARGEPIKPLFVLFQDTSKQWRIQAVPVDPNSFANRKSLPLAWAGLRDNELSVASGIAGGVFVHAGRFIGGNTTYEGVVAMAKAALEATE